MRGIHCSVTKQTASTEFQQQLIPFPGVAQIMVMGRTKVTKH